MLFQGNEYIANIAITMILKYNSKWFSDAVNTKSLGRLK